MMTSTPLHARVALSVLLLLGGLACKGEAAPSDEAPRATTSTAKELPDLVTLTPEGIAAAQLAFGQAERRPLSAQLSVPARLTFPQDGMAKVAARVPGRLVDLLVKPGQHVRKGDALGHVESPELARARADYLAAATRAQVTGTTLQREKELEAKGISSNREVREAQSAFVSSEADRNAAEAHLHGLGLNDPEIRSLKTNEHYSSRFAARSPIDGTVVEVSATMGQSVDATTPLFTVGELSTLWAQLDLFESQLRLVRVGQRVSLTTSAYPDKAFEGQIDYVGDVVDERTRAVSVRVVVPNPERRLKPGMFATATIDTATASTDPGDRPVVVPKDAVQRVGDQDVVFAAVGQSQFRAVRIKVGRVASREVEVTSGLEPGMRVVTQGSFLLKSELSKAGWGDAE